MKKTRLLLCPGFAILIAIFLVLGLGGCGSTNYPLPEFQNPPPVLELEELVTAYTTDPDFAQTKYEGKTFLFPRITANVVFSMHLTPRASEFYVGHGQVKFKPAVIGELDRIAPGFVIDAVGQVQGWVGNFIVITDCKFTIVEGGEVPTGGY